MDMTMIPASAELLFVNQPGRFFTPNAARMELTGPPSGFRRISQTYATDTMADMYGIKHISRSGTLQNTNLFSKTAITRARHTDTGT